MKLYPSILTSSLAEFEQQINHCKDSGVIEVIQIDIIDGYFADNLTISPIDIAQLDFGEIKLDFHLMTEEPLDFVQEIAGLKEYLPVRAIIGQIERMSDQQDFLQEVKLHGWKTGLSLDLYTPVESINPESWQVLDIAQIMTIKAGFQGQDFNSSTLEKTAEIKQLSQGDLEIIVDGGVKENQLKELLEDKINGVTVGSGFWKTADPIIAIQEYSQLIDQADSD